MDRDSSLKSLTIVETNFDEVGSSDSDSGLTFEESFASKKYAGSFRLRFSTTDASIHRGKEPTVWENPLARELPVHEETVYLDQRLANEPKQTKAAQANGSKGAAAEDQGKHINEGQLHPPPPQTEIYVLESVDHSPEVLVVNGNEDTEQLVSSARSPANGLETSFHPAEERDADFNFFAPEQEPLLKPDFRKRAIRAIEATIAEDSENNHAKLSCSKYCQLEISGGKMSRALHLTPELNHVSDQGFSMLQNLLFPAMPKFLTDLIVLAELVVTITLFALALASVIIENNRAFNITYVVIVGIALLFAFIDAFFYFVELGSCARIFSFCYSKQRRHRGSSNQKFHLLVPKVRRWLVLSYELVRTLFSELLFYPLVVLSLFDVIVGGAYLRSTTADRINFSMFIIGSAFLVVSVYFTRIFLAISAIVNIRCTPLNPSKSKSNMITLLTHFCVHVIFQIVVHFTIVIVIGVKIHQENPTPSFDIASSSTVASPFLICIIIVSGILPLYGIGVFFITNYNNLRNLSVGVWVNMLALLQSEHFATAIFANTSIKESKERAKRTIEKFKYKVVKNQFEDLQSAPNMWVKLLYLLRFPFLLLIIGFYEILVLSFIVFLAFTVDPSGDVQFILFEQGLSSAAFVAVVMILITNLHAVILIFL